MKEMEKILGHALEFKSEVQFSLDLPKIVSWIFI